MSRTQVGHRSNEQDSPTGVKELIKFEVSVAVSPVSIERRCCLLEESCVGNRDDEVAKVFEDIGVHWPIDLREGAKIMVKEAKRMMAMRKK